MKRKLLPIISREYKIVLDAARFAGHETALLEKVQAFWSELSTLLEGATGHLEHIKTNRTIIFYDTPERVLYKHHLILRERKSADRDKREITLKCRHPDRYISQDRNMHVRHLRDAEVKFEEDIKSPFKQLYSYSSGGVSGKRDALWKIKNVVRLFPGLPEQLTENSENVAIEAVNEPYQEVVVSGGFLSLGSTKSKPAECALIIWYNAAKQDSIPSIVEFSFRYGNRNERFDGHTAERAFDIFSLIQTKMTSWLGKSNATKTGLVFGDFIF